MLIMKFALQVCLTLGSFKRVNLILNAFFHAKAKGTNLKSFSIFQRSLLPF